MAITSLHLHPLGLVSGDATGPVIDAGLGRPLAGGPLAFTLAGVRFVDEEGRLQGVDVPVGAIAEDDGKLAGVLGADALQKVRGLVERMSSPRPDIAGLCLGASPLIMGIINVTPDSFSDGGEYDETGAAVAHGLKLMAQGAHILDVGGESTRPGAAEVSIEEELSRVVPVVRELSNNGAVVSIDTRHAKVMAAAIDAGAKIINDVSALTTDPDSLKVAAQSGLPVILMHMQGNPSNMQDNPHYDNAPHDIYDYLDARIEACEDAGLPRGKIIVDPGIGFGKTHDHNTALLKNLGVFHGLGCGILIGVSRKRFVAALSRDEGPKDRLSGSLAAAWSAFEQGVQMARVHDVAQTGQAIAVWDAIHASRI